MKTTDTQIEEIKGNKKGLKESNQTPSTKLYKDIRLDNNIIECLNILKQYKGNLELDHEKLTFSWQTKIRGEKCECHLLIENEQWHPEDFKYHFSIECYGTEDVYFGHSCGTSNPLEPLNQELDNYCPIHKKYEQLSLF